MENNLQNPQEVQVVVETELQPQQPQQDEATRFTCEICIEPMLADRKFRNSSLCGHPFCVNCIAKYVEVELDGSTSRIKCPGLNCKHLLDTLSCSPIMSQPTFVKWCDLLCDSAVSRLDKCYCPYQNCSVLVLNECKAKLKKVQCPNCKRNFCLTCKIPWHAGYSCRESGQLRDRNDVLVGQLIERNSWTRCYHCGHSVERISGCREIKCRCGAQFCHRCGGRSHLGPCKHKGCGVWFCFFLILAITALICYIIGRVSLSLRPPSSL